MWSNSPNRGFSLTTALMVLVICLTLTVTGLRQMASVKIDQVHRLQKTKAIWAAESGMAHALQYLNRINQWGELGGIDGKKFSWPAGQSALVQVKPLLGYAHVKVIGTCGDQERELEAMVGQEPVESSKFSLAIAEGPQPFFTSGDTRIEGDVALPGGMLESKALHGSPASAMPVVSGTLHASKPGNPPPTEPLGTDGYARLITQARTIITTPSAIPEDTTWELAGRTWAFKDDLTLPPHLKAIRGPGKIMVGGSFTIEHDVEFTAHPQLISGRDLILDGDLTLGCTLVAGGKLTLSGHSKGIASLISPQTIYVGPKVHLESPSWSWVSAMASIETSGRPTIMIEGQFNGFLAASAGVRTQPLVRIARQANVQGSVQCQGRLILESPFKGHIWTRQFESLQGARAFKNWLRSTQIEALESGEAVLPFGFGQGAKVLGWISR